MLVKLLIHLKIIINNKKWKNYINYYAEMNIKHYVKQII